jgi:membrane protein implicated in regulation of membrane protease activity
MSHIVALAWLYVALTMAVAEALSPSGSVLGALFTFGLYGLLPLAIVLYILGTPARRRARRRAESVEDPDRRGMAAGDPVAAEREEAGTVVEGAAARAGDPREPGAP